MMKAKAAQKTHEKPSIGTSEHIGQGHPRVLTTWGCTTGNKTNDAGRDIGSNELPTWGMKTRVSNSKLRIEPQKAASTKLASTQKTHRPRSRVFVLALQTRAASSKIAYLYGETVSGRTVYAYVEGNPLVYADPLGLAPNVPDPNGVVPGGPWTPKPGGKEGEFLGPKKPFGGRDQCSYVPDRNNGGHSSASEPYWKTKAPDGDWQRYRDGNPISPEEAHPGNPRPTPTNPVVPIITRILVGLGLMGYSGDAW